MSALNEAQIKQFAAYWYLALDVHAPAIEIYRLLADTELELAFPEKTMRSFAEFEEWLGGIYRTFFDENHYLHSVTITQQTETTADVDVVVAWQASWFTPPDAKSKRTSMNAYQHWTVRTSTKNAFGLEILKYAVDRFEYAPGFAQL